MLYILLLTSSTKVHNFPRALRIQKRCRLKLVRPWRQGNGPMESFWGMMKSEMYYLNKFNTYDELEAAIVEYIDYYNNHRYQKRLNCMSPLEYRQFLNNSAA